MGRLLKWFGYLLLLALGLFLVGLISVYLITQEMLDRVYDVPAVDIQIPSDLAAIERGRYLVNTIGLCRECHDTDLGGEAIDEGWFVGRLVIPNLTSGAGRPSGCIYRACLL